MPSKQVTKESKKLATKKVSKTKEVKVVKISNVFKLFGKSINIITDNSNIFGAVALIYFFLTILFVRGFSSAFNISQYKNVYIGNHVKTTNLSADFSAIGKVITTSSTSSSGDGALFQSVLFIIFSLIFLFALRELYKKQKISVASSFYESQYPIVQYLIILFFLVIELIPLTLGIYLYTTVFREGFAIDVVEKVVWIMISLALASITIFLMISSLFAIFIVTLPGVRPMQALRSSWKLVEHRRLFVLRKVIFIPIVLIILVGLLNLIFVAVFPEIADFVFYGISIIALLIAQSYLYTLYRELI